MELKVTEGVDATLHQDEPSVGRNGVAAPERLDAPERIGGPVMIPGLEASET
jgi:hypothetical protein